MRFPGRSEPEDVPALDLTIKGGSIDLWTIQSLDAIRSAIDTNGRYQASIDRSQWLDDPSFMASYRWMVWRMDQHGLPRPDQTTIEDPSLLTPVWACAKWTEEPETDGDGLDLIHLRLPLDRIILSDFDLFHCVLNGYGRALHGIKDDPTPLPVPRYDADLTSTDLGVNSEGCSIIAGSPAGVSRPLPSWFRKIWSQTPVEVYDPSDEILLPDLVWNDFVISPRDRKTLRSTPFIQAAFWEVLPGDVVEG